MADPPSAPGKPHCNEHGCDAAGVSGCHYIDGDGHLCVTTWCERHRAYVGVVPYCRRHADIVAAQESGRLVGLLPRLGSRSPSLVLYVCEAIEMSIDRILRRLATRRGGAVISTPVEMVGPGVRWQRSWTLLGDEGEGAHLEISVEESTDPQMRVTVNDQSITLLVPWIARRLEGTELPPPEDAEERRRFFGELIEHIREQLESGAT